ncbi:hypothetical protein [Bacillus sp. FSL K6-0067]|uniref:hypothetical protein n=1 Tax=Bacillus sp. FSL K6-0067 TaxID=2921412 RepID=UPI00077A7CDE|nr:hypothetical protein [Bacillus cereus]KXY25035.1 hypothetical protein AT267_23075 [Bacillus cereus]
MEKKIIGYTNSDIHLTQLQELIFDKRYLFIDTLKNEFITPQYQTVKKILQKEDILYISSLSDLGQTPQDILTEWIELTQNMQVCIIVLDLNTCITNKKIEKISLLNECILEMLYSLTPKTIVPPKNKTITMQKRTIPFSNKTNKFPAQFIEAYQEWKKGNITLFTAMKRCNMNGPYFHTLIKQYEKTLQ